LFDRFRRKVKKQTQEAPPTDRIPWSLRSWQGAVITTILTNGNLLTWKEIQEVTGLEEKPLNKALFDLLDSEEIYKVKGTQDGPDRYKVSDKFHHFYSEFYNPKTRIIKWIGQWRDPRKLDFSLDHEHFFLEGRHLDDFSKELICQAKSEVQIINPFIQDCDLSNTLVDAKKRGVNVQIITRSPADKQYPERLKKKEEYHLRLKQEDISLIYEEKVHAKLIMVDHTVAIVSSMNFYPESSAGVSWEVGLVSTDTKVVRSISGAFSRVRLNALKAIEKVVSNENPENLVKKTVPIHEKSESYTLEDKRREYPKAYEKWTPEEDSALTREYKNGVSIFMIAKTHQRQPSAIRARLAKLMLLSSEEPQEST
jgi:hypothetical protein